MKKLFSIGLALVLMCLAHSALAGEPIDWQQRALDAEAQVAALKIRLAEVTYERNVLNAYSNWTKAQALITPRREVRAAQKALSEYQNAAKSQNTAKPEVGK